MLFEIVAIFCTVTGACQDVHLTTIAEKVTPQQCMLNGQLEMVKWLEQHPGFTPRRLTCQRAGRYAKA